MLTQITIVNFRGFAKLVAQVSPAMVVMGPNSSGKTSMLHAVRLACEAVRWVFENEIGIDLPKHSDDPNLIRFKDLIIRDVAEILPLADWQALYVDQKVGAKVFFSIDLLFSDSDRVQRLIVEGNYARNTGIKLRLSMVAPDAARLFSWRRGISNSGARAQAVKDWMLRHGPKAVFVPPFYGVILAEEYRSRANVDQALGSADQSRVVRNLVADLMPEEFIQLNSFLRFLIKAELKSRTHGDQLKESTHLRVEFQDTNGPMEISAAGAGLVNLVALYASLARSKRESADRSLIYLLDEPEAHLHPRLQADMAERIVDVVVRDFGGQVIMATHSVEIINRMGQRGDRAALFRTDRADVVRGGVEIKDPGELVSSLAEWADLTPFSVLNFLASNQILFHEGPTDASILQQAARVKFRNDELGMREFAKWTLVALKGSGNAAMGKTLRRLLASQAIHDKVRRTLPPLRVLTVLDRDSCREPGFSKDGDGDETVVWGKHSIESLFLDASILTRWLEAAYPGFTFSLFLDVIEDVVQQADRSEELNNKAEDILHIQLLHRRNAGRGDTILQECRNEARKEVSMSPGIWQHGKERATFILKQLKLQLSGKPGFPNNFSTSLVTVLQRASPDRFPLSALRLPKEIDDLLGRMVTSSVAQRGK